MLSVIANIDMAGVGMVSDGPDAVVSLMRWLLVLLLSVLGFVPYCGICYLIYYGISLPARRQERARLFLDLLEMGLADGRSAEQTVTETAAGTGSVLGRQFQVLAACLRQGATLGQGLRRAPRLVPPPVVSMLVAGEKIGDIRKVLPACRATLESASSQITSAVNYLVVLILMANPVPVISFLAIFILPKFREIYRDLLGGVFPPLLQFLLDHSGTLVLAQMAVSAFLICAAIIYVAGPGLIAELVPPLKPLSDRIGHALPWRRKRMQRDFSAMLAILLDAEVPEPEAVKLAAESTANTIIIGRAQLVIQSLERGTKLPGAILMLDHTGEFRWRLAIATHTQHGFAETLMGWQEALTAQAYQHEQAVSQLITTGLIVFNGVAVGLVCVAVFQPLIYIVQRLALW